MPCLNWNKSIKGLKKIRTGVIAILHMLCTPPLWYIGTMVACLDAQGTRSKRPWVIAGPALTLMVFSMHVKSVFCPDGWYNHSGWLGVKHQVTYLLPLAVTDPYWTLNWKWYEEHFNLKQNLWLQICILLIFYLLEGVWLFRTEHVWDFCWCFALFLKMLFILVLYILHLWSTLHLGKWAPSV